ncbi:MAG: HD domain-containing phosphohydrolase [Erysipelotrichaceae bacterium]
MDSLLQSLPFAACVYEKQTNTYYYNTKCRVLFPVLPSSLVPVQTGEGFQTLENLREQGNQTTYLGGYEYEVFISVMEGSKDKYLMIFMPRPGSINETLQQIINQFPEMIFFKDASLVYRNQNTKCQDFFALHGLVDILGKTDQELPLDPDYMEECYQIDCSILSSGTAVEVIQQFFDPFTKKESYFKTSKSPIYDKAGKLLGIVGKVWDVTKEKEETYLLEQRYFHDSVTGVYNRAYFDQKMIHRIPNASITLGVVRIGIYHLPLIRDILGESSANQFLFSLVAWIEEHAGLAGTIARLQDSEFIVLFGDATQEQLDGFMSEINRFQPQLQLPTVIRVEGTLVGHREDLAAKIAEVEEVLHLQAAFAMEEIQTQLPHALLLAVEQYDDFFEQNQHLLKLQSLAFDKFMMTQDEKMQLALLIMYHNIGVIGLSKDEHRYLPHLHCEKAYLLAKQSRVLEPIALALYAHHEHFDGTGYPQGLKGEAIPKVARIFSILLFHEVLERAGLLPNEIQNACLERSGTRLDPTLVAAWIK